MTLYTFMTIMEHTYPGFVCYICLKTITEAPLQKCSGCKLIFYCCKEHQKLHWPKHKKFCKIIQTVLRNPDHSLLFTKVLTSEKKERHVLLSVFTLLCESILKRRMTQEEYQLLKNPFVCMVCRTSKNLITCKDCCTVTYCCDDHKIKDSARHSLSCKELNKKLEYYKNVSGQVIITAWVKDNFKLAAGMKSFLEEVIITKTVPQLKEKYALWYLNEIFTIPLTVIYAIEKGLSGNKISKNNYTIHVVGCRQFENYAVGTWQHIFHHFKMLDSIDLIYIGPEVSVYLNPPVLSGMESKIVGKKINFKMEPVLYHEYLMKKESIKPDVIIAFHCGFYDYKCLLKNETWKDSMQSLCSFPGAIVAFTSYREAEAKEDLKIFKECCATDKLEFLVESELNPFRNFLCDGVDDNDEICCKNFYLTVAKCI